MRAYLPLTWAQVAQLHAEGVLAGPVRGCAVDPAWRSGSPEVDEEQWEYEAQSAAAQELADPDAGLVLAVDVESPDAILDDGWFTWPGPIDRRAAAAVLTPDLAWFAIQELPELLAGR